MAARDPTQPANKKCNSEAERTGAIVQDGAKTILMAAGSPTPCARRPLSRRNAQEKGAGGSARAKRYGASFEGSLVPFGSSAWRPPPPGSRIVRPRTGVRTRVGIYLGDVHYAVGRVGPDHYCAPLD
eukprot:3706703-Pyramimonas_sp.AAC.1